ncbi:S1 RNA-binding domain-containing protein [Actinomadura chokoriensis]|uniref:S1 motif domain-containing protein n=1 Tax=Actinomadura chokoriensis TaxID=454156 RepID=A0ABV4QTV2_9ACTN
MFGAAAAIESFGVFVDLDEGPQHPVFPGVGFIAMPELSWHRFDDPSDIYSPGWRVTCEFLAFDTHNREGRLSLRATQPDPFQQFARDTHVGQILRGPVSKLVPFGAFVRVRDGIEGLIPPQRTLHLANRDTRRRSPDRRRGRSHGHRR